jgi:tetratricopeptide (TPR) repeat protein
VSALLQQAAFLLSSERFQEGLLAAIQGLTLDPLNVDLGNIAGVCAALLGSHEHAKSFWLRLCSAGAGNSQTYFNLGLSHKRKGQHADAEQCFRQAVVLDAANTAAHVELGTLLMARHEDQEAEQCFRQAITLDPGDSHTHCTLGLLLARRQRYDEAERCYRQAISLSPADVAAHCNLGVLLAERKCHGEAEAYYRKAIGLDPARGAVYTNLGQLLEECGRDEEAEQCYRDAMRHSPEHADAHSNLANLLARQGRVNEAEQYHRQAIALQPHAASAYSNLGVLLADYGREEEAEAEFRKAIALDEGYARARLNLAFLLLRQGKFAEGWDYHEARYDSRWAGQSNPPHFSFPQWRGEDLTGKSLLIWPEQGFGDFIQSCRYVPILKRHGAAHISLACRGPLAALMHTLEGVDDVFVVGDSTTAIGPYDYWTYPLSIPLHCKTTLDTIPAHLPYLHAAPERILKWASRLPREGFRIGLAWKGNPHHANDKDRSLPSLEMLNPLWSVPGIQFVSLQRDNGKEEGLQAPDGMPLLDVGSDIEDFSDAAAIVGQLDLVICVDTAMAHLTGALGKPCWILLPAYKTDWRWLHGRDDSPWYPEIMRLFRQQARGDWVSVIAEVRSALCEAAGV